MLANISKEQFEKLLPLASEWVGQQEKFILENGVPLDDDQQIDAYLVGVKEIQQVRLLKVKSIPTPSGRELSDAVKIAGILTSGTIGVSFRYGIYIKEEFWNRRTLIVHELTHTMQYERFGGIHSFLESYLSECIQLGYHNSRLEQEARDMEKKICFNE